MHRRNYTLHVTLALALIAMAAAAGRIERWEWKRRPATVTLTVSPPAVPAVPLEAEVFEVADELEAEVLVRFKPGVSAERAAEIAASLNDRVEDEIESVEGLAAIDDLDDASAESVAAEYAALPDVEYAEPNFQIRVEPLAAQSIRDRFVSQLPLGAPNDPLFAEQWGLVNTGQRGGRAESDVSALAAWEKTKGSRKVVVAVLDSGVDYTHPDLIGNMWHRPDDVE